MIPYIMITGYSNSGKTMVVRNLISQFTARGIRTAVIKHAHEGYDVDVPGKDSWHFFNEGADEVVVAGLHSYSRHRRVDKEPTLENLLKIIKDVDIIIVEGFKDHPGPKVRVYREGYSSGKLPLTDEVIALVEEPCRESEVPCFRFDELEQLAHFIITRFSLREANSP